MKPSASASPTGPPDAVPVDVIGNVSVAKLRQIAEACRTLAVTPHSVIELGKWGYAVVTDGNDIAYMRYCRGVLEFSVDPAMFSRAWKSRANKVLTDKLCDTAAPRRVWVRGVKQAPVVS